MAIDIADIENVIDQFLQYTDLWENDAWTDDNIVFVERVFSKILYDSPDLLILYEGKIEPCYQDQRGHHAYRPQVCKATQRSKST